MSFTRCSLVEHVSVNHPRSGGVERGMSVASAGLSCQGGAEGELEVLEVWEEADEIQYLSARAAWLFEGQ